MTDDILRVADRQWLGEGPGRGEPAGGELAADQRVAARPAGEEVLRVAGHQRARAGHIRDVRRELRWAAGESLGDPLGRNEVWRRHMTMTDYIDPAVPPSGTGCAECEAAGGWWLHLRRCALCGHIGCCDTSPAQHATVHAKATGHHVIRSFEPGEDWFWDYDGDQFYEDGPRLASPQHHPVDQGVPGPRGRVPKDWQSHLH